LTVLLLIKATRTPK